MKMIVIGKSNNTYRVFSVDNGEIYYACESEFKGLLQSNEILNYSMQDGKITYTQGLESRLPGKSDANFMMVIDKVENTDRFRLLLSSAGIIKMHRVSAEAIVNQSYGIRLVNAKAVRPSKGGKPFISALQGTFPNMGEAVRHSNKSSNKSVEMKPRAKEKIVAQPESKVDNLKNRLNSQSTDEILGEYGESMGMNGKGIEQRIKKSKYNGAIKKALVLGAALMLTMSLAACSPASSTASAAGADGASINSSITIEESSSLIDQAKKISIDVKLVALGFNSTVTIDDNIVGTVTGKPVKLLDTVEFKDIEGNIILKASEQLNLLTKANNWEVYDSDGNIVYTLESVLSFSKLSFNIKNADGETVATVKSDFLDIGLKNGSIKDLSDVGIAEIEGKLIGDYSLEINKDNESTISNQDLIVITSCYATTMREQNNA